MRGQVDLIDLQSMADGDYKYILNYQDHGIKDVYPVALKSKRVVEVAMSLIGMTIIEVASLSFLLKWPSFSIEMAAFLGIFKFIGPPIILHSDNGREFSNLAGMTGAKLTDDELGNVIDEIAKMWPGTYMVKGRYGSLF